MAVLVVEQWFQDPGQMLAECHTVRRGETSQAGS